MKIHYLLATITGIGLVLSACATPTIPTQQSGSQISLEEYDKLRTNNAQNTTLTEDDLKSADHPVCARIYENYQVVMAAHQPKKKSFMSGLTDVAKSTAGSLAVAGAGYAGGIVAAQATDTAIEAATYDPQKGMSELKAATSIIEVQRTGLRQANENGCPVKPMFPEN